MRLFILFLFTVLFIPSSARALSCIMPQGKELIGSNQLIFRGKALSTDPSQTFFEKFTNEKRSPHSNYTTFEVSELFKGKADQQVKVFHTIKSSIGGGRTFQAGDEYIVFANLSKEYGNYSVGACSTIFNLTQIKENNYGYRYSDTLLQLELYQSQKSAIDQVIEEYGFDSLYEKKAELLESYKDYSQAKEIYEELASKAYYKTLENLGNSVPYSYKSTRICPPAIEAAPDFLEFIKPEASHDRFGAARKYLKQYGRVLYNLGEYEAALRPLCLSDYDDEEAAKLRRLALANLGLTDELEDYQVDFSNSDLDNIDLSNLNLERANFENSEFKRIKLENSNLTAANLRNLVLRSVHADGVNLSGAILEGAHISGTLRNSDLSHVQGQNSKVEANLEGSSFYAADLRNASISGSLEGSDLTNANLEGALIHKLSGAVLENTNLNKIQSSAGHLPGSGANYSGVSLSGLDLSGGKFFSTDFTNANFVNSDLSGAAFNGSNMQNVDFSGANLQDADLSGTNREETDLRGADLRTASLKNTKLTSAIYSCETQFPEGFDPKENLMVLLGSCSSESAFSDAKPSYSRMSLLSPPESHYRLVNLGKSMKFDGVDLSGVDFEGANLGSFSNSNLTEANFMHSQGTASFSDSNLEDADFSYSNLSPFRLNGKNKLKNTKFYCAVLNKFFDKDQNFAEADLTAAIFSSPNFNEWKRDFDPIKRKVLFRKMHNIIYEYGDADYSHMDFTNCDLRHIEFSTTDLSHSTFSGAILPRTDFTKAKLEGADFSGAIIDYSTQFPEDFDVRGKNMVGSRLYYSHVTWAPSQKNMDREELVKFSKNFRETSGSQTRKQGAVNNPGLLFQYENTPDLSGKNLDKVNYRGAWLPQSNLEGVSMRLSNLAASMLLDANLKNTDLTGAVLYDAILDGADLSGANLTGADLRWARMDGTNLTEVELKNAIYDANTLWPEGFDPADAGAYLTSVKLPKQGGLPTLPEEAIEKPSEKKDTFERFTGLEEEVEIVTISSYVRRHKQRELCGRGHAQCFEEVSVSKKDKPFILVLAAYSPTTWRLNIQPDAKLEGVLVSGLYPQSIKGVPGRIKVVNHSAKETNYDFKFFGGSKDQIKKMKKAIRLLTGKEMGEILEPNEEDVFMVE